MRLGRKPLDMLETGEVGYIIGGHKNLKEVRVGETITSMVAASETSKAVPGFKSAKNMVFAGVFPMDSEDYELLKDSLERYALADGSLTYLPESSVALGAGFRCGFLGLLHVEIVQQRLSQEYGVDAIFTSPSAQYQVILNNDEEKIIASPSELPPAHEIKKILEPYMKVQFRLPQKVLGAVMELVESRRGQYESLNYPSEQRVILIYRLPMSEIIVDFFDVLKSVSGGYASMDYEPVGFEESDLVKVDILVNGKSVDALSFLTHRSHAFQRGRKLIEKLKDLIPKQQFAVALQAALGSRVIARETITPLRKDVTSKCYGGDISRKRKLIDKQKKGKKKMKQIGDVEVPQTAFKVVLNLD
jgi:GTP-binding protein LepA